MVSSIRRFGMISLETIFNGRFYAKLASQVKNDQSDEQLRAASRGVAAIRDRRSRRVRLWPLLFSPRPLARALTSAENPGSMRATPQCYQTPLARHHSTMKGRLPRFRRCACAPVHENATDRLRISMRSDVGAP